MQTKKFKTNLQSRLLEIIEQYRSFIIDPVEQEYGTTKNWTYVRSRLLKALGDRGLSKRISETLDSEFKMEGDRNEQIK